MGPFRIPLPVEPPPLPAFFGPGGRVADRPRGPPAPLPHDYYIGEIPDPPPYPGSFLGAGQRLLDGELQENAARASDTTTSRPTTTTERSSTSPTLMNLN